MAKSKSIFFFSPDAIRVVSVFACAGKLGRTLVYDLAVALFKLSCSQALERVVGIGKAAESWS